MKRPLSISLIGWVSLVSAAYVVLSTPFTAGSPEIQVVYKGAMVSGKVATWIMWPFSVATLGVAWGMLKGLPLMRPAWYVVNFSIMIMSGFLLGPEMKSLALISLAGILLMAHLLHTPLADRWFRGEPLPDDYPDYGTAHAVLGIGLAAIGAFLVAVGLFSATMFIGQLIPILFTIFLTMGVSGLFLHYGIKLMGPERRVVHIGGITYLVGSFLLNIAYILVLIGLNNPSILGQMPAEMNPMNLIVGSGVLGVCLTGYGGYLLRG